MPSARVIAIDWSGNARRAAEHTWLAEAKDGRLADLRNGFTDITAELVERTRDDARTVVGLDFAFSFPRWWFERRRWRRPADAWAAAVQHGEEWLTGEFPFWGRAGRGDRHTRETLYRRTDREVAGTPKSVFQVAGSGTVGTGSVRGMPRLLELSRAGFSVWPFDPPGWPRVVEIYPRALTGAVRKSVWRERLRYLVKRFPEQDAAMLERAAGSDDAFDAAVSALVMDRHAAALASLRQAPDGDYAVEGRIWTP